MSEFVRGGAASARLDAETISPGAAAMAGLGRIAFIGNSVPRRCGIATFTTDLAEAIGTARPALTSAIVAMTDKGQSYAYPSTVEVAINEERPDDYRTAAEALNAGRYDVVSLQHEFGIFGGVAGGHILSLLRRLDMPVVTTLHTVLAEPTSAQRLVMDALVAASARIVVMAEKGRELLRTVYRVPAAKIEVIPHGIPDCAFVEPDDAKAANGFAGRPVILTFGLLSPNKGIEVMIDAMPAILERSPQAVYVILGATHPNLVRQHGEAYRDGLKARVEALGIGASVVFLDRFVDLPTLLGYIAMCDVYVTPYLNEAQMTSGTLAYSFGLGKAVVSTPYWHACELLADDRGVLVPFGDAAAIGGAVAELLGNPRLRQAMRQRAYLTSREMTWANTAERYLAVFETVRRERRAAPAVRSASRLAVLSPPQQPRPNIGHLLAMCDDTGMFQHAVHSIPDRSHGYCVDDNARGLLLTATVDRMGESHLPDRLAPCFAAFVQHAWNPDTRRFRNFMSFDRRWLEDRGSEDSHGRTLWALGHCARSDADATRRDWAARLFAEALGTVEGFQSPRAWAFTLLGLDAYCAAVPSNGFARQVRRRLASRLMGLLAQTASPGWDWFEAGLAYDNARLPQALIVTGLASGLPTQVDAGLRTLEWLCARQTNANGQFRPVGTDSFGQLRTNPEPFDQQPLEATATVAACLAAARATGQARWSTEAARAFAWFHGSNDLGIALIDPDTGACLDGLHPGRANENRGGESVVSYLLSVAELRLGALQAAETLERRPARTVPTRGFSLQSAPAAARAV